ncbi:MAG: branched-chain amino acid transport system II carrier protein [Lactobacillus sp.]|jgi:LIVCS family branched-chain amino acid:cation transporter
MKKLQLKHYLIIASLIFGMFFGAGNLIFPVHLGQLAGSHWLPAAIGFIISGTLIPLAALLALAITRADGIYGLASPLGGGFALTFLILVHLTLGPLFATPRTATVPFAMFSAHFPAAMQPWALLIYSAIFFGIVYYASLTEGKITDNVGKILNPAFLLLLFIMFLFAFINPMGSAASTKAAAGYAGAAFPNGFLEGYNTLDALAALAFGVTVVSAIRAFGLKKEKDASLALAKTGLLGFLGIALIYFILIWLGASSLHYFKLSANGGIAFAQIANHFLGLFGEALLALLATITCMSSAIGLVVAFAQDFHKRFPKISYRTFLTFNCGISFLIANFGLDTIISWSTPVLMFLYPIAIALIFCGLTSKLFKNDSIVYRFTIFFALIPAIFDGINAAPALIANTALAKAMIAFASHCFPFFSLGLGWLTFGIAGYIIGLSGHLLKQHLGQTAKQMELN